MSKLLVRGCRHGPAQENLGPQRWSRDGWISKEAVDLDMDVLIQSGIYKGKYLYDELVDMQFVEAAK